MLANQLSKKDSYDKLNKVICINIVDFIIKDEPEVHAEYVLMNPCTGKVLEDTIALHFIQLKLINDYKKSDKLKDWMKFLSMEDVEEVIKLAEESEEIKEALKVLDEINKDPSMRRAYEAREKELRDEAARMADSKEEGRKEGREEGRKEGREEARQEIIDDWKSIVNDYFKMGLSVDDIINKPIINKYLSREDVARLENEIKQ